MKCSTVTVGGATAIVCGSQRYESPKACNCGAPATKLCDWIIRTHTGAPMSGWQRMKLATCDEPICDGCATSPTAGKDLCKNHAEKWAAHPQNPAAVQGELLL